MEGPWLNDADYGLWDIGFEVMGRAFREAKAARFSGRGRPVRTVVFRIFDKRRFYAARSDSVAMWRILVQRAWMVWMPLRQGRATGVL